MRTRVLLVALALVATSCATGESQISGDVRNVSDVTLNLRVEPARVTLGQRVRLTLSAHNNSGRPNHLRFPTAQRYEFRATRDGREVWRWGRDQPFEQEAHTLELQGQTATRFSESWQPDAPGTYVVRGEVLAEGYGGELSAEMVVEQQ